MKNNMNAIAARNLKSIRTDVSVFVLSVSMMVFGFVAFIGG